ncbi:MAG: DNA gyrase inhibitor YacG [Paracoccaceae bacterium]|nr:DNA gyrase inhibitor YacG [Paracoccaceae bacterium]MDE2674139.1 DNA gyrase inhibitor YacG [Paracoccaceae bacterium]MDE2759532.1 DNA gyrase inhibitor YacG [Paracoccaceae bacterium]MDE2917794.1 DNA gyrase inhibitor YacG [Paracoccaceae bacterium]MXZ51500.1 DNA gyrase inhibitor YacG [Paracoccaceae bacterium]
MNCPICKKLSIPEYQPFCSKRCADIDLGNWLDGKYVLSGNKDLESENEAINVPPISDS